MSNVQISRNLWDMLCDYFFDDADHLREDICREISEKVEKMNNRELFSQYKQASGSEREQLRNAYLDQRGISSSFRTDEEYHEQAPEE